MPNIDWAKAEYLISCVGMADAWMCSFEADGIWLIEHGTPGAVLVPLRADGGAPASLQEVVFIANCIAFDHDMPTVVRPSALTLAAEHPPVKPVVPSPVPRAGLAYFEALELALMVATDLRVGNEAVALRYDDEDPRLPLFSKRFSGLEEPLSMYAMATRQVDWMSEYLCLYRVLEWVKKDNGKPFISAHLGDVETYDFGALCAHSWMTDDAVDVFGEYRSRAWARITALRHQGRSDVDIAEHLYAIRNGLAHGKGNFLVADFGADVATVAEDLPIVKLLSRMVVDGVGGATI